MKKKALVLLLAVLLVVSCTACGGSAKDMTEASSAVASYDSAAGEYGEYYENGYVEYETETVMEAEEDMAAADVDLSVSGTELPDDGRKIIRNTSLEIETKSFDESVGLIRQAVQEANGYIEYSSHANRNRTQRAEYVCRIPADRYSAFLDGVQGAGSVVNTVESTEDATAQYVDMEARLKSLRTQEERLLELMEESGSLEELLAVQDKLMEVQYQIESYTAQLKVLSNRVDYATVEIWLVEVETYTPVEPSFGERIADAFGNMLTGVKDGAQSFVIVVIRLIPLWIFGGVAAVIIVVLVKRHKRRAPKTVQPPYYPPVPPQNENTPKK